MIWLISVTKIFAVICVAVAALWVVTAVLAAKRVAGWNRDFAAPGQFITVDGTRVHYETIGDQGPALVLIHGASGNTRDMMQSLAPALADRYRVIVFDRPGLGWSDPITSTDPADQAALLQRAALALGAERPLVLGHSYGGAVAMAWAIHFPDHIAGVVDLSGAIYPWPGGVEPLYRVLDRPVGNAVLPTLASALVTTSFMQQSVAAAFAPEPALPDYLTRGAVPLVVRPQSMRANAAQINDLKRHLTAQSVHYGALGLPIEILHGDADLVVGLDIHSRRLAETLPQARLTVLAGGGHMIQHTRVPQIVAAIDRIAEAAGLNSGPAQAIVP